MKCICGCGKEIIGKDVRKFATATCRNRYRIRQTKIGCIPIKQWTQCDECGEYFPKITRARFCTEEYMDRNCSKVFFARPENRRSGTTGSRPAEDRKNWRKEICFDNINNQCDKYSLCLSGAFEDKPWEYEITGKGCFSSHNSR